MYAIDVAEYSLRVGENDGNSLPILLLESPPPLPPVLADDALATQP